MKVIEHGYTWHQALHTCKHCGCFFEYTKADDLKNQFCTIEAQKYTTVLRCPECGEVDFIYDKERV